ncbi:ubiquitin-like-conjugating enzyme ATG10 [Synchiropus splendidus]|uniref:ubiquitin-like-conjugating enzyme ATG10 n=1 Tax=Synchiropus splendidus TaxID=270530 RepID=UPI00237D6841|nr:ubiquitin-like-conjugating enzyme ATG10 [Synchiropus splendidus]
MGCWLLDEKTFTRCCRLLLQKSEQLRDGWSWEPVQGTEEGYLRKTTLKPSVLCSCSDLRKSGSDPELHDQVSLDAACVPGITGIDDEDDEDGSACRAPGCSQVLQYEYHVLYSCSYGTPVLYFRTSTLEGRSLSLEEVCNSVHPSFRTRLQLSPLNTITQQEHPVLGQPFFMLHPCRTEEFMKPIVMEAHNQKRSMNYVVTWLSVVGPLVGLDVPLKYCSIP